MQHFLERHGLEEESPHDISPSDLLPMDTRPSETKRRSTNSLRHSMSGSPSILNSSYNLHQATLQQHQQQHHHQHQQQNQQYTDNGTDDFKEAQHQQHSQQPQQQQQPSQLVTAEITQVTSKSIALPPGTALLSVVPKSPSSINSTATNGSGLLRSPSASLVPVPRRCLNSTPVSRRSSISSPEPWTHCTSGSSGIGSTASSSGGEPSSPSTVGGHSSVSSSRASNHSANGFIYSPENVKQQQHLSCNKKNSVVVNRRSSISGCSLSGGQNGVTRIPGMNDISRTSSFTNSPQGNKLIKRRSLDAGSNRNLMNRSFLALNGKGTLGQQCPPSLSSSTRSLIPTPVCNKSRYINYLASSQHITNASNTSVNGTNGRSSSVTSTNASPNNGKATCVKDLINGNSVLTNGNSFNDSNTLLSSIPKRTTVN